MTQIRKCSLEATCLHGLHVQADLLCLQAGKTHPESLYYQYYHLSLGRSQSRPRCHPRGCSKKDTKDCPCHHQDLHLVSPGVSHPQIPVSFSADWCVNDLRNSGQTDSQAYNASPSWSCIVAGCQQAVLLGAMTKKPLDTDI